MGRLDQAMRRAAEEQAARANAGTVVESDPLADAFLNEAPAPEPSQAAPATADELVFPSETALPVSLNGSAADDSGDADPAGASAPLATVADGQSTLFINVDTRLATKTVVDDSMLPSSREQYRRLAASLHQAQRTSKTKVVMVASAVGGEGKTLTAANLALTLSESYLRNVLLVDGDLRRPSLHTVFQVDGNPGLSDGLIAADEPKLPLHRLSPRLTILPAGRPTSDPIGALTSDRMRLLIDEAREVFDWVIIDTPPVGLLTDAALLSAMADGVVLVVKAGSTPYDMVNRAVDLIGRERLMGVVLNRATEMPHRSNYDYSNYYYGGSRLPVKRD
jgi:capsular exopolysaccharide synthesis family protein